MIYLAPRQRGIGRINLAQIGNRPHAWYRPRGAREHDRGAVRQRLADGLEGLAPHDDDLAGGHLLEPLEILGQMPRDAVAGANHPIERHGGDGFEGFHTAMGALMPGCGL